MAAQRSLDFDWRSAQFARLVAEVKACRLCPRMAASERVLGYAAGDLDAKVMFIGEAPGRLGADASQIPFHGDKAGENFETLLQQAGLSRYEAFVTNAVLCNPKDAHGNNATPTLTEIENCSAFLRRQIGLVDARVIVTLGNIALRATKLIEDHGASLEASVRNIVPWNGRVLIPAYHPGQRATVHRSLSNQLADFRFIAQVVRRSTHKTQRSFGEASMPAKTLAVVTRILEGTSPISYFALHKLFFLVEVEARKRLGKRLTESYVIRQKDGPYFVDLHLKKLLKDFPKLGISRSNGQVVLFYTRRLFDSNTPSILSESEMRVVTETIAQYGRYSDRQLKTRVYLTRELRDILKKERRYHLDLLNTPLLAP